jgi:transcriptional regulator of arginine metabolism
VPKGSGKRNRHEAILELVRTRRVHSQDELRVLLKERGFAVTQATLSRDLRDLRVAKVPHVEGEAYYAAPRDPLSAEPALEHLLPHLLLSVEGVENLVVVKTLVGGAQAVAEAIDRESWPEIMGTVAGDDTILIVLRDSEARAAVTARIDQIAER